MSNFLLKNKVKNTQQYGEFKWTSKTRETGTYGIYKKYLNSNANRTSLTHFPETKNVKVHGDDLEQQEFLCLAGGHVHRYHFGVCFDIIW